ncbi:ABC-type multidrug transport system, ATPase component [Beggiatoa alba B18LD]|uniref:ABC-type multidrug transport system, ATPase component n=1 Tax=Beggiatoa alba B18LD TaxID=395493 RepID=I3CCP5_9GAMM|nr:ABC transporter ATP-binding protein [Beggiatoa alba]EIJ41388.1 ABC-type multidrug transport system, ATPase component [Beggiatoa alba B18LD]
MSQFIEIIDIYKHFPVIRGYRDFLWHSIRPRYVTALHQVSLSITQGELFCILGENGAGKTTLLKILCTLMLPNSGRVLIQGLEVTQHARQIKALIGYVLSDERSFYWRLTGRENLQFFATLQNLSKAVAKARIQTLSEQFALTAYLDKPFQTYSTGTRRKLAFIRGLLTDPPLILMDEPSNALDSLSAMQIWQYIQQTLVKQQGKTVVVTEHNLQKVEQFADRFAILKQGQVKTVETLRSLRQQLQSTTRYQLSLQTSSPTVMNWLKQQGVIHQQIPLAPDQYTIEIELNPQVITPSAFLTQLVGLGASVSCFVSITPSLETLFTAYYQHV